MITLLLVCIFAAHLALNMTHFMLNRIFILNTSNLVPKDILWLYLNVRLSEKMWDCVQQKKQRCYCCKILQYDLFLVLIRSECIITLKNLQTIEKLLFCWTQPMCTNSLLFIIYIVYYLFIFIKLFRKRISYLLKLITFNVKYHLKSGQKIS